MLVRGRPALNMQGSRFGDMVVTQQKRVSRFMLLTL